PLPRFAATAGRSAPTRSDAGARGRSSVTPSSWTRAEAVTRERPAGERSYAVSACSPTSTPPRSEEHTSELQSRENLVCRLLLERSGHPPHLHSFPTRRSSDLTTAPVRGDGGTVSAHPLGRRCPRQVVGNPFLVDPCRGGHQGEAGRREVVRGLRVLAHVDASSLDLRDHPEPDGLVDDVRQGRGDHE